MIKVLDGDAHFLHGLNSSEDPATLPGGTYYWSENMVNRGGVLQTRPGSKTLFALPEGKLQGFTIYKPKKSFPELVFAVEGQVFVSQFPYKNYTQLENIRLSSRARDVFWCNASNSVTRNPDNSLRFITPKTVLFIQDTLSPPAFYDGTDDGHISGSTVGTPQGGPMCFTGNRLWVARNDQLYASDIEDPFSFQEQNYLGGLQAFLLPEQITGLSETTSTKAPQLVVFTKNTTTLFQSFIRNRLVWSQTADFQTLLFPNIGSVNQRSIVPHFGLLWWFSSFGLTAFDSTFLSLRSSKFAYRDNELAESKANLSDDPSTVAAASFENYFLCSVPSGDLYNRHTWVSDHSVLTAEQDGELPNAWSSVWTGFRPVEWGTTTIGAKQRIFCASVDADGKNRVREFFQKDRRDDNCPISWAANTRAYTGGQLNKKRLRYADFHLVELSGTVDIAGHWAGYHRGRYKKFLEKRIEASVGIITPETIIEADKPMFGLKKQSRVIRSQDAVATNSHDALTSCGVEHSDIEPVDKGFSLCIEGSGECAIRAIQVFADPYIEDESGKCEPDESGDFRGVRFDGAASLDPAALEVFEPTFTSTQSVVFTVNGVPYDGTGTASSKISQQTADKIARAVAEEAAVRKVERGGDVFVGGFAYGT